MHPRRGSSYMEKAIDKASMLIELLTKENTQLKATSLELQDQLQRTYAELNNLQEAHQTLTIQNASQTDLLAEAQKKCAALQKQLSASEAKLEEKSNKNKQLHEKLADFTSKNQELAKGLEKERKRNLCLANENQFLMNNYRKQEAKQNILENYCEEVQEEWRKEVILVDRTKQAFARKCEQLKLQNTAMRRQLSIITPKLSQLQQAECFAEQSKHRIAQLTIQLQKTNDALCYIIESTLRMKPESGPYLRVEQVKNYLQYRLQHIENLIKPIVEMLGIDGKIQDVSVLAGLVNRLAAYLGELVKS